MQFKYATKEHFMEVAISVIVPVYQVFAYLDHCVQSLLAQTFSCWELILVDDGSTDGSLELCQRYAKLDSRIQVLHQNNAGVSAARNTGLVAAQGLWIAFVDADDWVEPEYLQKLYERCSSAQISLCDVDDGESRTLAEETLSVEAIRTTPSRYAQLPYINYVYNKLFSRSLLFPEGPRFDVHRKRGEDAAFVAACLLRCRTVAVCPEKLYHYRATPDSATHHFYDGVCRDEKKLFGEQNAFFDTARMDATETAAFARWQYGKIISVLRYIARYAPDSKTRTWYIREFLAEGDIYTAFATLPEGISGRSLLYAFLTRRHRFSLLGAALRLLG